MLLGLVLAGLSPVWLRPEIDAATGLPLGITPADGRRRVPPGARGRRGSRSASLRTSAPMADVAGIADVAHAHDAPLVVDAAWAAHFGFHRGLPRHALQQGADALVTSAHKTLPAWSQAALDPGPRGADRLGRLDAGVEASATTSPAGAILASIEASRP